MILSSNDRSSLNSTLNSPFVCNNTFSNVSLGADFFCNFFKPSLPQVFSCATDTFFFSMFHCNYIKESSYSNFHMFIFLVVSALWSTSFAPIFIAFLKIITITCSSSIRLLKIVSSWFNVCIIMHVSQNQSNAGVRIRRAIVQCRCNTFFSSFHRLCLFSLVFFETRINHMSCDPWLRYDGGLNDVTHHFMGNTTIIFVFRLCKKCVCLF